MDSYILIVDDGSSDNTWEILEKYTSKHSNIKAISFSKNYGKENALLCGYQHAECDACISLDIDLQDDISKIEEMIDKYYLGYENVIGVRLDRGNDSFFKKYSAHLYYSFMTYLRVNVIKNHADYRLVSSKVLHVLKSYNYTNFVMRNIINNLGFNNTTVFYSRLDRAAGTTNFTFKKLFNLAIDSIFSSTYVPLHIATAFGFLLFTGSCVYGLYLLLKIYFFSGILTDLNIIVLLILSIFSVQFICMGILGMYIARMWSDIKGSAKYIINS